MEQILNFVNKFGVPLVITAIVLWGAFRMMNIYIDDFERKRKQSKDKQRHDKLIEVRRNINKSVNTALERVLLKTGADRVFVFEYHNGGTNLTGLPFLKMSNTYEVVDVGIIPQRFNLEGMSIALFAGLMTEIMVNSPVVIKEAEKDPSLQAICYETLAIQNIHTCVLMRITDIHGKIVGYCGVDFVREDKQLDEEAHVPLIKDLAVELGALLSVDDEY